MSLFSYSKLKEKIDILEDYIFHLEFRIKRLMDDTIESVEKKLMRQIEEVSSQCKSISGSKPYKCPVCEGKRRELNIMPNGGYFESECISCKGKGIVWG